VQIFHTNNQADEIYCSGRKHQIGAGEGGKDVTTMFGILQQSHHEQMNEI